MELGTMRAGSPATKEATCYFVQLEYSFFFISDPKRGLWQKIIVWVFVQSIMLDDVCTPTFKAFCCVEQKSWQILGKCPTTQLHAQPLGLRQGFTVQIRRPGSLISQPPIYIYILPDLTTMPLSQNVFFPSDYNTKENLPCSLNGWLYIKSWNLAFNVFSLISNLTVYQSWLEFQHTNSCSLKIRQK